jgi:hypothetical protein
MDQEYYEEEWVDFILQQFYNEPTKELESDA